MTDKNCHFSGASLPWSVLMKQSGLTKREFEAAMRHLQSLGELVAFDESGTPKEVVTNIKINEDLAGPDEGD